MTKNYKILAKFIKDMSSETPDAETFIFVKDNISKYQLNIDINSKALKNKMIEINTIFKFEDKEKNQKKSYFEINFATIVKINDEVKEKNVEKANATKRQPKTANQDSKKANPLKVEVVKKISKSIFSKVKELASKKIK